MTFQYSGLSPTGWTYGMDSSDSGKLKWAYSTSDVSSSTRMTLMNDGKLGIGTTSPSYKLDVSGDINLSGSLRINGTAQTFGGSVWSTSGSNVYRSSGNVGIGTSSPGAPLDVRASGGSNPGDNGLIVYNSSNSSGQDLSLIHI